MKLHARGAVGTEDADICLDACKDLLAEDSRKAVVLVCYISEDKSEDH